MVRTSPHSLSAALTAIVFALCTGACTVPLAPGYRILKESREVRFVSGPPPELQVRARFTLENTGSSDLTFTDAVFPSERIFGRKNLRVEVNGREATLAELPEEYQQDEPNALRIPFNPPWTQKQTIEMVIAYALSAPEDSGTRITLGGDNFHLGSRGWFPVLQPPKHLLAPFPRRPDPTIYTIRVPADFRVLARGTAAGRRQDGGEIEYRYELHKGDLAPYVVAGRYVEPPSTRKVGPAMFWTLQPLKEDPAPTEERIGAAWGVLQNDFGTLDKNIQVPHVVESPELRAHVEGEEGPAAVSFPGGALVNSAALALGIASEDFFEKVTHALAHNWFGDEMYPTRDAALGMGEGLPEYTGIVIEEALNGEASRRKRVLGFLREYDEARKQAVEKPLGVTVMTDPNEQRRIARAKAPLFFIALEDAYGERPVRSGLRNLVTLLRGQEVGYDDLRAALERSTGNNLAEPFRVWLYSKGIPQDFRDRYKGPAVGEKMENGK